MCAACETVLLSGIVCRFGPILLSTASEATCKPQLSPQLSTMADLSRYLLIDASTGTVLTASTCYLVDDNSLTSREWLLFDEMSDSEVCNFAKSRGKKVSDVVTLRAKLPGEL